MEKEKIKTICKKALLERKGWTESALRKFAPKSEERPNPWGPYLPPMRVYEIEDVERIEATHEFAAHLERHLKLSEACKKARAKETPEQKRKRKENFATQDQVKTERAIEFAASAPIEVRHVDHVDRLALKADGDRREAMGWKRTPSNLYRTPFYWKHRVVLYHIINELSNFPELQAQIASDRKMQAASGILRTRVCAEIDRIYPELGLLKSEGFIAAMTEFGCMFERSE